MLKSRFSALLSLLLVFLSGVLVGGFTYRLYNVSVAAAPNSGRRLDPEEARKHIVADMRDHLKLDARQVDQLQQIFDQTRDQFHQIHDKMNAEGQAIHTGQIDKVKAILRADQLPLYEQWRAERELERKQHSKQSEKK
jgi:Spy/CpxP family protein refolding chaperone